MELFTAIAETAIKLSETAKTISAEVAKKSKELTDAIKSMNQCKAVFQSITADKDDKWFRGEAKEIIKSIADAAEIEIPEDMWELLPTYLEQDLADAVMLEELSTLIADDIPIGDDNITLLNDSPIFNPEDFDLNNELHELLKNYNESEPKENTTETSATTDACDENTQKSYQKEIDGKMHYYDDNGKLYRVDNELQPNSEYDLNGYHYTTDDQGRIVSAEGKLHLKNREERLPIKDTIEDIGKGDQKPGDDRGHLIGDQFDGSNGLENMIPQNADINRNNFRSFENELAKEVKAGNDVYYKVEPVYEGDSKRPSAIVVSYSINGVESIKIFPNNPKG